MVSIVQITEIWKLIFLIITFHIRIPKHYVQTIGRSTVPGAYDRSRKSAVVRSISSNYSNALSSYFGTKIPNQEEALGSHNAYVTALRAHGTEVTILPELPKFPDSCFVEDTAVMVHGKAIIPNMGHPSREGEQQAVIDHMSNFSEIIRMPKGAKLDGGDVVFFDDKYLVGISTRTNKEGADFLSTFIKEDGYEVELINVPETTLHLTTVCSSPREGTIIAAEGHLKENQISHFAEEIIWIPNNESYASNTIGYSNDRLIVAGGFPKTKNILQNEGFRLMSVDMDPIMQADGSLTCLSVFTS
jgi:dimethylargininase